MRRIILLVAPVALIATLSASQAFADSVVNVTPASMNNWTTGARDPNGDYYATPPATVGVNFVSDPSSPNGVGSANLFALAPNGDSAAILGTASYAGTPLSAITSLLYNTYSTLNNGQQFPWLDIGISTTGGTVANEWLSFEPPYQTKTTGNKFLPNQGPPVMNTWQTWNALEGGWYSNASPSPAGTPPNGPGAWGPGEPGVISLAHYLAAFPNATLAVDPSSGDTLWLQVGFGSGGPTDDGGNSFNGNVASLTIGTTSDGSTTFNFEPNAATPEPAELVGLVGMAGVGLVLIGCRRRVRVAIR